MKTHIVIAGSDILYHGTYITNAISVLTDKKFVLSPSVLSDEARHGANWFFLSTARTILTKFLTNRSYVIFELDGRKLGQRYKIKPVNYHRDIDKKESEDRVFSTEPTIPIDYVTSIHVPINYKNVPNINYVSDPHIQAIKRLGKKLGIPTYFYATTFLRNLSAKNRVHVPLMPMPLVSRYTRKPDKQLQVILQMILAHPMSKLFDTPRAKQQIKRLEHEQDAADIVVNLFRGQNISHYELGTKVLHKMRKLGLHAYSLAQYIRTKIRMRQGYHVITDCINILTGKPPRVDYLSELEHQELKDMLIPEILIIKEYGLDPTEYNKLLTYGDLDTVIDKVVYVESGHE